MVYEQRLIHESPEVSVSFVPELSISEPKSVEGRLVMEPGSPIIWFTYPGKWHDIGCFYAEDGRYLGLYANVLTPVEFVSARLWRTTDLFLDVWCAQGGDPVLLDEDELHQAEAQAWIEPELVSRARQEAERLLQGARDGTWPPRMVHEWTLERALMLTSL